MQPQMSNVGPYVGVSHDKTVTYDNGEKLRFLRYSAYNAFGLIGSEYNGIAVLDDKRLQVVCDNIACDSSSYFGPSAVQLSAFQELTTLDYEDLVAFLNNHERSRYALPVFA